MRLVVAALPLVAACWTDATLPPQTPIGAVEPTAKRKAAEPPADDGSHAFAQITGTGDVTGVFGPDDPTVHGGLIGTLNGGAIFGGGVGGAGQVYNGQLGGHQPLVTLGSPMISGDYEPEVLRRIIRRHLVAIEFCYQGQLVVMPTLGGTITLRFTISADGKIVGVAADSPPALRVVAQCVQRQVSAIELPKPIAGVARVVYPIVFTAP